MEGVLCGRCTGVDVSVFFNQPACFEKMRNHWVDARFKGRLLGRKHGSLHGSRIHGSLLGSSKHLTNFTKLFIHLYIYTHKYLYVCMHIYIYVFVCVYIYICIVHVMIITIVVVTAVGARKFMIRIPLLSPLKTKHRYYDDCHYHYCYHCRPDNYEHFIVLAVVAMIDITDVV